MEYNILNDIKNYKELKKEYKSLKNLKEKSIDIFGNNIVNFITFKRWEKSYNDLYKFSKIIERQFVFFALLKLDNPFRAETLGLTSEILDDPKKIKKWFRNISTIVHPDKNFNSELANKAMQKINLIKEEIDFYE